MKGQIVGLEEGHTGRHEVHRGNWEAADAGWAEFTSPSRVACKPVSCVPGNIQNYPLPAPTRPTSCKMQKQKIQTFTAHPAQNDNTIKHRKSREGKAKKRASQPLHLGPEEPQVEGGGGGKVYNSSLPTHSDQFGRVISSHPRREVAGRLHYICLDGRTQGKFLCTFLVRR
jgi:hypothetical protein